MSIVIQLEIKRESIQKIDMKKDIVRDKRDIKIEHQRPLDLFWDQENRDKKMYHLSSSLKNLIGTIKKLAEEVEILTEIIKITNYVDCKTNTIKMCMS